MKSSFCDMQPGGCVFCQLEGQAGWPPAPLDYKGFFEKLILQRWMITSTTVHLIPQEKHSPPVLLSTVALLKDIDSATSFEST